MSLARIGPAAKDVLDPGAVAGQLALGDGLHDGFAAQAIDVMQHNGGRLERRHRFDAREFSPGRSSSVPECASWKTPSNGVSAIARSGAGTTPLASGGCTPSLAPAKTRGNR